MYHHVLVDPPALRDANGCYGLSVTPSGVRDEWTVECIVNLQGSLG